MLAVCAQLDIKKKTFRWRWSSSSVKFLKIQQSQRSGNAAPRSTAGPKYRQETSFPFSQKWKDGGSWCLLWGHKGHICLPFFLSSSKKIVWQFGQSGGFSRKLWRPQALTSFWRFTDNDSQCKAAPRSSKVKEWNCVSGKVQNIWPLHALPWFLPMCHTVGLKPP